MRMADQLVRDVFYHRFRSARRLSGFIHEFATTSQIRKGPYVVELP